LRDDAARDQRIRNMGDVEMVMNWVVVLQQLSRTEGQACGAGDRGRRCVWDEMNS